MKKENAIIAIVAIAVGGFVVSRFMSRNEAPKKAPAQPAKVAKAAPAKPADNVTRHPGVGAATGQAKVTVIEISDFECPFCSRGANTVNQVKAAYKDKVRVQFVNLPLSFHRNARPAGIAALAAHRQGKFWQMHDKLFGNQRGLTKDNFRKFAKELGLDVAKFDKDLADPALAKMVDQDTAIANGLGVRGTPGFFVNGVNISGAQPFENFKKIIEQEITKANDELGKGTKLADLHAKMWRKNNPALADNAIKWLINNQDPPANAPPPPPPPAAKRQKPPEDKTVWKAKVAGHEPAKGPKDALVYIVEYTDFECPFCSRVRPSLKEIEKSYGDKVRLVFKNQPLPFHKKAFKAAEAALCAHKQGKFWEMEERLFTNQSALARPQLSDHAKAVGLNVAKFDKCVDSSATKKLVLQDQEMAERIKASGTPAFYINGRKVSGAQPFSAFKKVIDEELAKAQKLADSGTPRARVYEKAIENGKEIIPPPVLDSRVASFDYNGSPIYGDKNAKVKVVVYKDFECPFCGRVSAPLKALEKANRGKVAIVFKHFPLSNQCNRGMSRDMHPGACQAAYWSFAALEQGKFNEFESMVFNNMRNMMPKGGDLATRLKGQEANLRKYAQQIGMNVDTAASYVKARKWEAKLQKDIQEASAANVRGTPSIYMNGRAYNGPMNPAKMGDTVAKLIAGKI